MSTERWIASLAILFVAGACGPSPCSPDTFGLSGARDLALRPAAAASDGSQPCRSPGVRVLSSEAELRAFYDGFGAGAAADGGAPLVASGEYPIVDFSGQRVIVSESPIGEAPVWVAESNGKMVAGLAACARGRKSECAVVAVIVETVATEIETRTCSALTCGRTR